MSFIKALPLVGELIDRFVPNPQARLEFKHKLQELEHSQAIAGLEATGKMFSNHHWFVAGAIPAMIWPVSFLVVNNFIIMPWIALIWQVSIPAIEYPPEYWYLVGTVVLGLFGKKAVDNGIVIGPLQTGTNKTTKQASKPSFKEFISEADEPEGKPEWLP